MSEPSSEQKKEMLDFFGKMLIEDVRDRSLDISMSIAKYETPNPVHCKRYECFSSLSEEQKEAICDLLSETITDTIYNFLTMFEYREEFIKLVITKDGVEYNLCDISEEIGAEITFMDEEGWIQKFSKIGRFVL